MIYEWVQDKVGRYPRSGERRSDNPFFAHPPILAFLESSSSARGIYYLIKYIFNYEVPMIFPKAIFSK